MAVEVYVTPVRNWSAGTATFGSMLLLAMTSPRTVWAPRGKEKESAAGRVEVLKYCDQKQRLLQQQHSKEVFARVELERKREAGKRTNGERLRGSGRRIDRYAW